MKYDFAKSEEGLELIHIEGVSRSNKIMNMVLRGRLRQTSGVDDKATAELEGMSNSRDCVMVGLQGDALEEGPDING